MHHRVVLFVTLLASTAYGEPLHLPTPATAAHASGGRVCSNGRHRCHVHVRIGETGDVTAFASPVGWGAPDLQSAYDIDPTLASTATIAIVDAYGYPNLESDLARYRTQYNLGACTRANSCLKIVNQSGQTSPLPSPPPQDDDWTVETALDVDMASAACPHCKLVVVQAADTDNTLYESQTAAVSLGATVISNSWGHAQTADDDLSQSEPFFMHPGIATFVSSGDSGYDEGGNGPHYPSTSAFAIAVGGTELSRASTTRGWSEVAWSDAGSACSLSVAKPAYQATWPCAFKATTDLSAAASSTPGVAIFNSANGGWINVYGTSAAAPLVASMFAALGRGDVTGPWIAQHASKLNDVTSGSNGACGTALCNAGIGWDGPTGFGTPDVRLIGTPALAPTVAVTSPQSGATVQPGFKVETSSMNATHGELWIDGALAQSAMTAPLEFDTSATLADGAHALEIHAYNDDGVDAIAMVAITVASATTGAGSGSGSGSGSSAGSGDSGEDRAGGCAASQGGNFGLLLIAIGFLRRRR